VPARRGSRSRPREVADDWPRRVCRVDRAKILGDIFPGISKTPEGYTMATPERGPGAPRQVTYWPVLTALHRFRCASAIRARPSGVLGPDDRPPCNRQRQCPLFVAMATHLHFVPRRVRALQRSLSRMLDNTP
jgi:hypothetical protein